MKKSNFRIGIIASALAVMMAITTIIPITVFAADTDIVYITHTGAKYHRQSCRTIAGTTHWAVTKAQAKAQGLSTCHVCWPDDDDSVTATVQPSTVATTAAVPATTSVTPEQAVQQAYALYMQNGLDSNSAFARVQALTAQLAAQPSNYAQIVQNDLASLQNQTATVATSLTAQDAVQKAFALYVQSGLDSNSAFARVQAIVAQLGAQPDNYAQIVQNDLANAAGQVVSATGITAAEAVQQAFALYVQKGLDTNAAFARVQALTAQLAAQPNNYAQIVQTDLTALGK